MGNFTDPTSVVEYPTASTTVVAGNLMMATSAGLPVIGADTAGAHFLGLAVEDYDADTGAVKTATDGDIFIAVDADAELGQELYIIDATTGTHTGSTNSVKIGWLMYYVRSLTDHTQTTTTSGAGYARVRIER